MPSIVLELQRDALDQNVPVSALLRKSLVVARKLHLPEFQQWIERELAGYRDQDEADFPAYRELRGTVKAHTPYRGWIPVMFPEPQLNERLSRRHCTVSIPELESIVAQPGSSSSTLDMPFAPDETLALMKGIGRNIPVTLIIGRASLVAILDAVRTTVLNWALKLEEDGITGESLSFTEEEKDKAQAQGASYNVNNFFARVEGLQLQQGTISSVQVSLDLLAHREELEGLIAQVRTLLPQSGVSTDDQAQAKADLATIEMQLSSPRPKPGIIIEALRSVRSIAESATGSGLFALLPKFTALLASVF